jgi:hypothetical protein
LLAEKKRRAKAQRKAIISSINVFSVVLTTNKCFLSTFSINSTEITNSHHQLSQSAPKKNCLAEFNKTDPKRKAIQKEIIYKNTNKNLKTNNKNRFLVESIYEILRRVLGVFQASDLREFVPKQ